ncbi:hypothetical protein HPP92_013274 [Vanilla planifolia]|uniref:Uncharacterized protein n=1 Tax=Vanilla planifolia TaxID=51239 RepID=A0A835QVG5_VANPL|nr:hypothetical protein HPP92_013750 [Vanilla planifolia]KAG0478555.1 hypothetical protein HPP92_013274 [Vanilla planifolia]
MGCSPRRCYRRVSALSKAEETKDVDFADVLLRLQNDSNGDLALTKEHIEAIFMVIIYADACFMSPNLCTEFRWDRNFVWGIGLETSRAHSKPQCDEEKHREK